MPSHTDFLFIRPSGTGLHHKQAHAGYASHSENDANNTKKRVSHILKGLVQSWPETTTRSCALDARQLYYGKSTWVTSTKTH
eukprot:2149217-Amphidinium_carterae.1